VGWGKVICDTNVLVDLFDRTGERYHKASYYVNEIGMDNILISAITEMELIKGTRNRECATDGKKAGKDRCH